MDKIIITDERIADTGDLYGIFFEDLNHAADGGLYAEMIRNRSFEFSKIDNSTYNGLTAWRAFAPDGTRVSLSVSSKDGAGAANPHYLVMAAETNGCAAGVKNEGFNSGLPIHAEEEYTLNIRMKAEAKTAVTVAIVSGTNTVYDKTVFNVGTGWQDYSAHFVGKTDDFSARLLITVNSSAKIMLDFVSLFPVKTFNDRPNGMRRDLAQLLFDMHPKFMRFPGGCLVHDGSLDKDDRESCYRWKNTLGDVKSRPSRRSNWGYNQSLGLGYYEYFLFCEDIGAQPLPVLPAGYNPHTGQGVPFDELGEWVDDALDLIEFANGDSETTWGAVRAKLGHPEKFNLKYIAIGNEEVGDGFFDRYDIFHNAIKKKYPDIKIINSAGPFCAGSEYEKGWASARKNKSDLIDEHYYVSPDWLLANINRYDDFDPNGTRVFLGEYASCDDTYYNALAEAAYMTALENNVPAVALACYAPLFANDQYRNWLPVLIRFDNHRAYGTPSYYVQKMFMCNQPHYLLKTESTETPKTLTIGDEFICGDIEILSDKTEGEISDIRITDNKTGHTIVLDTFSLKPNEGKYLACVNSADYTVEATVKRLSGEHGFKLIFGKKDDSLKYEWSVGGWENQDCLITKIDGCATCLTQSRFSVETGVEYKLKLEIKGRHITDYINGVKENDIVDNRLVLKDLYYTVGMDDNTHEIIIKAVNVTDAPVKKIIEIPFAAALQAKTETISGCSRSDRNSFESPKNVYPQSGSFESDSNSTVYEFKPMSVNIIRISF